MGADVGMIVQLAVVALLTTVLLVVWGDLGGFGFVHRTSSGVKLFVGLLAIAGLLSVVVLPKRSGQPHAAVKGEPLDLDWKLLSAADGKDVNLLSLKGKVLFINVWATWCPPCVMELPSIERLHARFAGRDDVAFLLISTDSSPAVAQRFAAQKKLKAPVYFPKAPAPKAFETESIPATFIVRKDGVLEFFDMGAREWDQGSWPTLIEELTKRTTDPALAKDSNR